MSSLAPRHGAIAIIRNEMVASKRLTFSEVMSIAAGLRVRGIGNGGPGFSERQPRAIADGW
jgi:hypothetical protein